MTVESRIARTDVGISRRRLVQGAAWATPAILIATAAPAFAASPSAGSLVIASSTFSRTTQGSSRRITIGAVVAHAVPANAEVTNVTLRFTVNASRGTNNVAIAAQVPSIVTGAGWTAATPAQGGSDDERYFDYVYNGAALSGGGSTTQLTITVAVGGGGPYSAVGKINGAGVSLSQAVQAPQVTRTAG